MRDVVEIGLGKTAQRGYHLDDCHRAVPPHPRRRRRLHGLAARRVPVRHPAAGRAIGRDVIPPPRRGRPARRPRRAQRRGSLDALRGPEPVLEELAGPARTPGARRAAPGGLRRADPPRPDRGAGPGDAGGRRHGAVRVSPQHTLALARRARRRRRHPRHPGHARLGRARLHDRRAAEPQGVHRRPRPAGHRRRLHDYKTALHLMRTGAAGVIVGVGGDDWSTTDSVLGIRVPMATAIADAAAARRDYLDETGGRYVHLIADGDMRTSGDIAKALGCGADAVMLGEPLSLCAEAPGGAWWIAARTRAAPAAPARRSSTPASRSARLEVLFGPRGRAGGRSTSSAACAGRWPSAATATSRSSRRPRCSSPPVDRLPGPGAHSAGPGLTAPGRPSQPAALPEQRPDPDRQHRP